MLSAGVSLEAAGDVTGVIVVELLVSVDPGGPLRGGRKGRMV